MRGTLIAMFAAVLLVAAIVVAGNHRASTVKSATPMTAAEPVPGYGRIFMAHFGPATSEVATEARGFAKFTLDREMAGISYKIQVADIMDVEMAHIHLAPAPGPIVVWLYPPQPPAKLIPGRFSGMLQTGSFDERNFVGPLQGASLGRLLELMESGGVYVNVHTTKYPAGEISGIVGSRGPM